MAGVSFTSTLARWSESKLPASMRIRDIKGGEKGERIEEEGGQACGHS
jgi:hypothetical protein